MISAPKIHTDLLWDLTFLFVGLAVLYFIGIFFLRNTISNKAAKVSQRKKELSPMVNEFLFHEEDSDIKEKTNYLNLRIEIRELLRVDLNRVVLSEILLDLSRDVSGDTKKRLFKLYQDLDLDKDAFYKLKSWRWEVVSKGILELTQMQVTESYSFIIKFINDKRSTIRKQAEIATVTLKHEGINYFLDTTKYRISEWQQLKLLNVIRNLEDYCPPRFKAWLTSKNKDVVLFAMRLIKFYNQNDASASLIELLKHRNNQIKQEAIQCIKEFHIVEALDTLKLVFQKGNMDVKISILEAIAVLGSTEEIEFLKHVEAKYADFAIKSKAISVINRIVPESIMPTENIDNGLEHDWNKKTVSSDIDDKKEMVINKAEEFSERDKDNPTESLEKEIAPISLSTEIKEETVEPHSEDRIFKKMETTMDDIRIPEEEELLVNLDFLPIVVAQKMGEKDISLDQENFRYRYMGNEKLDIEYILQLAVNFEEIGANGTNTDQIEPKMAELDIWEDLDISELHFLPIVTSNADKQDEAQKSIDSDLKSDIGKHTVHYEQVLPPQKIEQKSNEKIQLGNKDKETPSPINKEQDSKRPNSISEINGEYIRSLEVEYDILDVVPRDNIKYEPQQEYFEWPLDELDSSNADQTDDPENESHLELEDFLKHLPKPKYYNNEILSVLQLLDLIEALGDQREIPLLHDIMEQSKMDFIKERAKELIKRFSRKDDLCEVAWELDTFQDNIVEYNIFEELFTTCDTDSKIILMKEMLVVGDQKEVRFLKKLLREETEQKIQNTAKKVLRQLQERLFKEEKDFLEQAKNEMESKTDTLPLEQAFLNEARQRDYDSSELP
ncbi:HEAT repeat domain-containing protein [Ulvibacterium marinum]|uniref:HEAT repeat domain-containing protein n=1 Tax=Ulvibacterium marinum TaxID=2419782 RepID=UPI00249517D0|nr:hypothetical protein [Ulvibacterium marinum]